MSTLKGNTVIRSQSREIINNVIMYMDDEKRKKAPNSSWEKSSLRASEATGVSVRTIYRVRKEASENEHFSTPGKKRNKKAYIRELDDFEKCVVRRTIYDMYLSKEIPTLSSILEKLSENIEFEGKKNTLRKILKDLGFKWRQWNGRKFLLEKPDIVSKRREFLKIMKENASKPLPNDVVYIDETWLLSNHICSKGWQDFSVDKATGLPVPCSRGNRFIICHAGTKNGFVSGASLFFRSKSSSADYHDEMNARNFLKWFKEKLIPNIPPKSYIIMDNAPYHSAQIDKAPTGNSKKADIRAWLEKHNISYSEDMLKAQLLQLVRNSNIPKKYVVDEFAANLGHRCIRLPPYHCDLNPIELAWADAKNYVGRHNASFSSNSLENLWSEALDQVTTQKWTSYISHVDELMIKYWTNDRLTEEFLENDISPIIINIQNNSNSESDSDSDSDDN